MQVFHVSIDGIITTCFLTTHEITRGSLFPGVLEEEEGSSGPANALDRSQDSQQSKDRSTEKRSQHLRGRFLLVEVGDLWETWQLDQLGLYR